MSRDVKLLLCFTPLQQDFICVNLAGPRYVRGVNTADKREEPMTRSDLSIPDFAELANSRETHSYWDVQFIHFPYVDKVRSERVIGSSLLSAVLTPLTYRGPARLTQMKSNPSPADSLRVLKRCEA